jgi:hypothetical protein
MARQTNIKLSGTYGNVIFYQSRGEAYMRSKPATVKRVPVAIQNSLIFGTAASSSRILRSLLAPILPMPGNRLVMYRVNRAFSQWLRSEPETNTNPVDTISFFNGLSLQPDNELQQYFKIPVKSVRTANGTLQLQLPPFDPVLQIKAPKGTIQVQLQIGAAAITLVENSIPQFCEVDVSVNYVPGMLAPQLVNLPMATGAGRLVIVALSLQYSTGNTGLVTQPAWQPAGVVGSFYN